MQLFQSKKFPIGVDISERSLKVVQLAKRRGALRLAGLAHTAIPPKLVTPDGIANPTKVAGLLKELLEKPQYGTFSGSIANACLPETKTFFIRSLVPLKPSGMPAEVIKLLEKNVPYPPESLNYDWETVGKNGANADIAIGAIESPIAESYSEMLTIANITPAALELEPIAITRALLPRNNLPKETIGIIDIGAIRSSFIVHRGGAPLSVVSLPISGAATTAVVAKKLKTTDEKAEGAKIVCGLNPNCADGEVADALQAMVDSLVEKIKNTLLYLEGHLPNYQAPTTIFLCGGGATIKNLPTILTERLGITTHLGNVFHNIQVPARVAREHFQAEFTTLKKFSPEPKHVQDESLRFTTAIGLALRGAYHTDA